MEEEEEQRLAAEEAKRKEEARLARLNEKKQKGAFGDSPALNGDENKKKKKKKKKKKSGKDSDLDESKAKGSEKLSKLESIKVFNELPSILPSALRNTQLDQIEQIKMSFAKRGVNMPMATIGRSLLIPEDVPLDQCLTLLPKPNAKLTPLTEFEPPPVKKKKPVKKKSRYRRK